MEAVRTAAESPARASLRIRRVLRGTALVFGIIAITLLFSNNPLGLSIATCLLGLASAIVIVLVFELALRRLHPDW